jgi:hypothetical protein
MGEFDDMNATPLGKLPMPVVQSKADGPSIDARSSSYEDILKDMRAGERPQQAPQFPPAQERFTDGGGQFNPRQLQQLQQQQAPSPAQLPQLHQQLQQLQQPQQLQHLQQHLQEHPQQHMQQNLQHPLPLQHPQAQPSQFAAKPRRSKPSLHGSTLSFIGHYKSTLIVIGIVFLVLTYVAPRLSRGVPRLLDPTTGRFNVAGIAVLALVSGGMFRGVDRAVGHWIR